MFIYVSAHAARSNRRVSYKNPARNSLVAVISLTIGIHFTASLRKVTNTTSHMTEMGTPPANDCCNSLKHRWSS